MIAITSHMRLLAAVEPADFRRGIDGLARLCREALGDDPFRGTVFLFRNRRATSVKLLVYDGQGFWLCQKRLSRVGHSGSDPNSPAFSTSKNSQSKIKADPLLWGWQHSHHQ